LRSNPRTADGFDACWWIFVFPSCCFRRDSFIQPSLVKTIELGTIAGELKFVPDHLTFSAGRRYQLQLTNNSSTKHYFTAKDFADAIWSQKVDAGNVEIKGAIHELELRPGTRADWVFIPLRAGIYQLRCTVPGHTEAGMVGTIEVTG
jgi:uncharacterized cupredoxin-like copper-binding protein